MDLNTLIPINADEYRFLSEKFEFVSEGDSKEIPKYIILSKRNTVNKLIALAIENELEGFQKEVVKERYFENMKINDIALKHETTRQCIHRTLKKSEERLFSVLKYAYFCGFSLINPPKDFEGLLNFINEEKNNE